MIFKNMNTFGDDFNEEIDAAAYYLVKKGVQEKYVDRFLMGPLESDYLSPMELDNMEELIDGLHEAFSENKIFFLQVDPDADGFTSASIFYNFFTTVFPGAKIEYRLQENKEHGIILNTVPVYVDVVVVPDAGSNQVDEHEALTRAGKKVFIMDHHVCENPIFMDGLVMVNSQFGSFSNRDLSGAGVVYKVIEAYDNKYLKRGLYKDFEDLAAIGIVGDMMDIRHIDNNAIIWHGMRNIKNPMIKAIIKEREYSISDIDSPNKTDISFYIVPLINAVIRSGNMEEKYQFFEGFIKEETEANIKTVSRGFERVETLHQFLARIGANLKAKQDRHKQKSFDELVNYIELDENFIDNKILITKISTQDVPKTVTGLIAMELSKKYFRPSLLLRPVTENGVVYYRGSGRNVEHDSLPNLMEALSDSGLIEYCQGHDNAFGVGIEADKIDGVISYFNERLKDVDLTKQNFVDMSYNRKNFSTDVLGSLGRLESICGRGIPEPLIHFEIEVQKSQINVIGGKKDVIKFFYEGVSFVIFKAVEKIQELEALGPFGFGDKVKINVIGVPIINTWNGNDSIQVRVKEIEFDKIAKSGGF